MYAVVHVGTQNDMLQHLKNNWRPSGFNWPNCWYHLRHIICPDIIYHSSHLLLDPLSPPSPPYSFWNSMLQLVIDTANANFLSTMHFSCAYFVEVFWVLVAIITQPCFLLTFSHIPLSDRDTFVVVNIVAKSCLASVGCRDLNPHSLSMWIFTKTSK